MTGLITQRPVSDVLKRLREENITAIATDNVVSLKAPFQSA